jgi:hypothetical protein
MKGGQKSTRKDGHERFAAHAPRQPTRLFKPLVLQHLFLRRPSLESVKGPALFEKQIKLLELRRFRFYSFRILTPLGTVSTDQERKLAKNERATEDDKRREKEKKRLPKTITVDTEQERRG